MVHIMGDVDPHRFKKLSVKQLPKRERLEGGDEKFWNKFQVGWGGRASMRRALS